MGCYKNFALLLLSLCCFAASASDRLPSFTIFACPRPYSAEALADPSGDAQLRALSSWLALKNRPEVVLFGSDASLRQVAARYPRVSLEVEYDANFLDVPLFNSLLGRALYGGGDVSLFVNGDVMLFDDLVDAAARLQSRFTTWVATSARRDLPSMPFATESTPSGLRFLDGGGAPPAEFYSFVRQNGTMHSYGGTDVWLWNNVRREDGRPLPLHSGVLPPFTYGRGVYDNWLNHEIESTKLRDFVDISLVVLTVHVDHDYKHIGDGDASPNPPSKAKGRRLSDLPVNYWSKHKKTSWELFANSALSFTHGSYVIQKGTSLHATTQLLRCEEATLQNMCLTKRVRPANCTCEYSSSVLRSDKDPALAKDGRTLTCGSLSPTVAADFVVSGVADPDKPPLVGLPHTLEELLPRVADADDTLVLTGFTGSSLDMLMSFVCTLRKLGVRNVLIAAFDETAYKGAFLQGLPVFLADSAAGNSTIAKLRATLRVLQAGYNVLHSDVDVLWFANPLPELRALSAGGSLLVQSNEPNASMPANGERHISGGFYFATASEKTIAAFEAIINHTVHTPVSEHSSIYDVICGADGKQRQGDDACQQPQGGLHTAFLDRDAYPTSKHRNLWDAPDVVSAAIALGSKVLVLGSEAKINHRKVAWRHYDEERMMCQYSWAGSRPGA
jgi:hypothetical protein